DRDDRLQRVEVVGGPAAQASLHETLLVDGISRMRARPEGFVVPAGGDFALAPGGAHVMLSGELPASGAEPATLRIRLQFEHGGDHEVTLASP
ncbi:MAG: copper chaperone PCu(A)C, partial [Pseudomonadota bacterium]